MRVRSLAALAAALVVVACGSRAAHGIALVSGLGGPRGYGDSFLPPNDDGSSGAVDITSVFGAQGLNFFGSNKTSLYVNNNGNLTFIGPSGQYTPTGITQAANPIIAAFFADVDTRGDHTPADSNLVYYDLDPVSRTFTATWDLVGYFNSHTDKRNNFQIRLIGTAIPGDFDIELRYDQLQWTTGDASGGQGGLGGTPARAGYSAGNSVDFFEFPESGDQNAMLDLVSRSNVGTAGLFIFQVRNGGVTPPPTFTASETPTPAVTVTPKPGCQVYQSTDVPKDIADLGQAVSTVLVPSGGALSTVGLVSVIGHHGWFEDLDFQLVSPIGTTVTVLSGACGDYDGPFDFGLDDAAPFALCADESPPTGGTLSHPTNAFTPFTGQAAAGTWTLRVLDTREIGAGRLDGWGLQVCFGAAVPTPTPTATVTPRPGCERYSSTDIPKAIPDEGQAVSTLHVPTGGALSSVNLASATGVHGWFEDLDFHLISPIGTDVTILSGACGDYDGPFDFGLDDAAAFGLCADGSPPDDGQLYNPTNSLAPFAGQAAAGTWTLRIVDTRAIGDGRLDGWTLEVCFGTTPVPTRTATATPTRTATPSPRPTHCQQYDSTDVPVFIPDDGVAFSQIQAPAGGEITSVTVTDLAGTHTYVQDLRFTLVSPAFTDVLLIDRKCGATDDFDLNLDDLGIPLTCPMTDGLTHRPDHPLATLNGEDAFGTWVLQIEDLQSEDFGVLQSWGLYICVAGTAVSPTPTETGSPKPTHTATPTRTRTPTRTASPLPPTPTHTPTHTPTDTPAATHTATPTHTPTHTPTPSVTVTGTQPPTGTPTRTLTASHTATMSHTATLTATPTLSATPSATATATRRQKFTFTPTLTPTATQTPTSTATSTSALTPSATPSTTGSIAATSTPSPAATPSTTATGTAATATATATRRSKFTLTPTRTGSATQSPTATLTGTPPTSTPTISGTVTPPTPTVTGSRLPTASPTPTATPAVCACVGDCNCDGEVTVDSIITMVNVALDLGPVSLCPAGDPDMSGHITVDEILIAVNNALSGCPLVGTTPTATPTAGAQTPGADRAERAAGASVALAQSLRAIPAVLSTLTQLAGGGAGVGNATGAGAAVEPCETGTRDFVCTQTIPGIGPRDYVLTFTDCRLDTAMGGSITLRGTMSGRSTAPGTCNLPPTSLSMIALDGLEVVVTNPQQQAAWRAVFDVTGAVTAAIDLTSPCLLSGFDMTLSGTIEFHSVSTLNLTFDSTRFMVEVEQFNMDCVPVVSLTTLTGAFAISGGVVGASFAGSASPLAFADDTTSGNDMVRLDGRVDSSCLGGTASLDTDTALLLPQSSGCPTAGSLLFTVMGQTDRITYTASGGVAIDVGNDGGPPDTYPSCFDLQACPGG